MRALPNSIKRNQSGSTELVQFIPVLGASLGLFLLVSFNLLSIITGYASIYICARESCAAAAKAANFQAALGEMTAHASSLTQGPVGKLGRLSPNGGYGGSGADLYLATTNIYTSKTSITPANEQLNSVDTSANVYECRTDVHYLITPFFGLASAPILGDVPGIGKPLMLTCSAHKAIEQPTSFALESQTASQTVASSPDQTSASLPTETCGWDISNETFKLMPGQTIAQQATGVVNANNSVWVTLPDSNGNPVSISKGQRISVIANPSSLWSYQASAYTNSFGSETAHWVDDMPVAALEFKVGTSGPAYRNYVNSFNMQLPGQQGVLYFRCNDTTYDNNSLAQNVKVLVTN